MHKINLIVMSPAHVIASKYFYPVWLAICYKGEPVKSIYPIHVRPKFKSLDGKSSDMWASRNPYIAVFLYGRIWEK